MNANNIDAMVNLINAICENNNNQETTEQLENNMSIFDEMYNNLVLIVREARHLPNLDKNVYVFCVRTLNFIKENLEDIKNGESGIMLDAMDALKDCLDDDNCIEHSHEYAVLNSFYDVLVEAYFENV